MARLHVPGRARYTCWQHEKGGALLDKGAMHNHQPARIVKPLFVRHGVVRDLP